MAIRDLYDGTSGEPDRWGIQQRALLCLAAYKDQATFQRAADNVLGGPAHLWVWFTPNTTTAAGFAIVSRGDELLVVIRGTENLQQWTAHIVGSWGREFTELREGVFVHTGMFDPMENRVLPALRQALDSPPPGGWRKVRITGHSYGAGVAEVLAFRLLGVIPASKIELCTFGKPRTLSTGIPVEFEVFPYARVEGPVDVITHMPPPLGNLRAAVSTIAGSALGAMGLSKAASWVGGQAVKVPFGIPMWRHYGDQVGLALGGRLSVLVGQQAPFGAQYINPERPRGGHVMDEWYYPMLDMGWRGVSPIPPELVEMRALGAVVLAETNHTDPFVDWWAGSTAGRVAEMIGVNFPATPGMTGEEFKITDGIDFATFQPVDLASIGAATFTGGGSMATWRYTAYVSWGDNGRSIGINRLGPANIGDAYTDALNWVRQYKSMFGNTPLQQPVKGNVLLGSPGKPCIEWIRVSDVLTPRNSQRFRVPGTAGAPFVALSDDLGADMPWVSVSLSVLGVSGGRVSKDVVSIVGQPDGVASNGGYFPNQPMPAGGTFRAALNAYLAYILPPNGVGWGFMGRDMVNAPDTLIEHFGVATTGEASIVASTANWVDGEYIRIVRSGVPYYNREWRVKLNVDDTYTLLGSRPAQALTPSTATGYRTRLATGVKQQTFYAYSEAAGSFNSDDRAFIAKRNPGRRYDPLASRRRRRTPAK